VLRVLIVLVLGLGAFYLGWRYLYSINWSAWPMAVALVVAETYSYVNTWLFGLTIWRLKERGDPPPPPEGATVDVFITCYNEPVEIVRATAEAARDITFPHSTYILDDADSPDMAAMAREVGIGYLTRSAEWAGKARHAKAGNLNNALLRTTGEFLLILDADQIPAPEILDRTLGYFSDPKLAAVQTHQWFYNVPRGDPFGSHAYFFYGPIQQGKDGWNAAFFCGSNGLLRREALMQIGIRQYVRDLEPRVERALATADRVLARAKRTLRREGADTDSGGGRAADDDGSAVAALDQLRVVVADARAGLKRGTPIQEVTWQFQQGATEVTRQFVRADLERITLELADLPGVDAADFEQALATALDDDAALSRLAGRERSPLAAIATVRGLLMAVDLDRGDEALPVMAMSTISVTEDMGTALRLHAAGWRSAYHDEVLARGTAPQDLRSALNQRLRWAQGSVQVMLLENPATLPGLAFGQRLMYLATMISYWSGFASVVYLAAPLLYMFFLVLPVKAFSTDFLLHLLPYLLANFVFLSIVGWGRKTWRGQQYALALFPLWIRAVTSALGNVCFGRDLGFVVTPKTSQATGTAFGAVWIQLVTIVLLVLAMVYGIAGAVLDFRQDWLAVAINSFWIVYNLVLLSVVITAASYRATPTPPPEPGDVDGTGAGDLRGRAGAGRL
jgi:cellulose synthase (UDP-forming)